MNRVLIIANGVGFNDDGPGISGGDVRWIEIAKQWSKDNIDIHVLTTDAGVELADRLGLEAEFHQLPVKSDYSIKSYIQRIVQSYHLPEELSDFQGVIYASTEHLYDVLPGARLHRQNSHSVFVVVAHWVAPFLREGTTKLNSILFFLNQRVSYLIIKRHADMVIAVSESTADAVSNLGVDPQYIRSVGAGVPIDEIERTRSEVANAPCYQGVFMKRFDGTKGIYDVVRCWEMVTDTHPEAKLALIGGASDAARRKVEGICREKGIQGHVEIFGPIYDSKEKYRILLNSQLFLLPSYEENWAIVIGEAMAAGVPVLCYDIPEIRQIWDEHVQWTPRGDESAFAREIISLLEDDVRRNEISERAKDFVRQYSWENIARGELEAIRAAEKV